MDENKENIMSAVVCREELDDSESTGSRESEESKEGSNGSGVGSAKKDSKWDFKKFRNAKRVPKLLQSLTVPSPLSSNPPKQLVNAPASPDDVSEKQDPERFFGDGVNFKAKLIGIKEVGQARGDRLAQDALAELKASVKASNSHKQKILINVSIDGIKIKDEKGTELLHHHHVHKISFIAQDIADTRAFGYVFGSPALGHNFFAIKTEKNAQQVVVAMRDLFQVVFNLRKKEMKEKQQQHQEQQQQQQQPGDNADPDSNKENSTPENSSVVSSAKVEPNHVGSTQKDESPIIVNVPNDVTDSNNVPDLLDLEVEQHDSKRSFSGTAEDLFGMPATNDPFFADPLTFISSISSTICPNTGGSFLTVNVSNAKDFSFDNTFANGNSPAYTSPTSSEDNANTFTANFDNFPTSTPNVSAAVPIPNSDETTTTTTNNNNNNNNPFPPSQPISFGTQDKYAPLAYLSAVEVSTSKSPFNDAFLSMESAMTSEDSSTIPMSNLTSDVLSGKQQSFDADFFSDLDPLGKDRPFVDKKDFFHEVKNPPKKVLKDLVMESSRRSSSPPSSDASSCSAESIHSFGSPPLSTSPPPPQFPVMFPSLDESGSSGNSSPFTGSELGSSFEPGPSGLKTSNGFDDSFFNDEFNLPSPTNPPPPLPIGPPPPLPPPRPVVAAILPPPLPPKRNPIPAPPLIKLNPPPDGRIGDQTMESGKGLSSTIQRPGGTLPIPIPVRRPRPVVLGTSATTPLSIPLSTTSSTTPSRYSNTPDGSLTSVSSLSQGSTGIDLHLPSHTSTPNGVHQPRMMATSSPVLPPPPPNSLTTELDNQSHQMNTSRTNLVNNNSLNNNLNNTTNNDNVRRSNRSADFDVAWIRAAPGGCQTIGEMSGATGSIFHRKSDPFADDFFTSLPNGDGDLESSVECRNKFNQHGWTSRGSVNPFDPFLANGGH